MRTENSIRNIYISMLSQVVIILLGFVSRKFFLDSLGTEYLGINGLLTNVLSMLSLVEGGIGTSIVYNLYKPLAENDEFKITALVQLYKRVYTILAIIIVILSVFTYPILVASVKGSESIDHMVIVYLIFVVRNAISYINAHKWSLIYADQKNYILAKYTLIFNIITTITKIIVLTLTKNYVLFLLIEVVIFILQNIYNGSIVDRRYPYIKTNKKYIVDKDTKKNIFTNVKALFLHNLGTYCVYGTDNLLIAGLVNLKSVGLYSNYDMIIGQLGSLLNPILNGISASVGNLIATESKERTYEIFKVTYLVNFWVYALATIFLYNLLEPFIDWWLREGLLLDKFTFIVLLVNFYIKGLRQSVVMFKSRAGIFNQDKYVPIIEAIINLFASFILANEFGMVGIFLGTTISSILLPLWNQSRLVYKEVFNKPTLDYFKKYVFYILITIVVGSMTSFACNFIVIKYAFISLVLKGIICIVLPNLIFISIFYNTEEFKYLLSIFKPIFNNFKGKLARI